LHLIIFEVITAGVTKVLTLSAIRLQPILHHLLTLNLYGYPDCHIFVVSPQQRAYYQEIAETFID